MNTSADQFKINLNQNLWSLLLSFMALGAAEHYQLCTLYWFAVVLAFAMLASVIATTIAYTINYCKGKFK